MSQQALINAAFAIHDFFTVKTVIAVTAIVGGSAYQAKRARERLAELERQSGREQDINVDTAAGLEIPILYGRTISYPLLAFPGTFGTNLPYVPDERIGGLLAGRGMDNEYLLNQFVVCAGDIQGVYNAWNADQPITGAQSPQSGHMTVEWKNGGEASDMATRFCSTAGFNSIPGNGSQLRVNTDRFTGLSYITTVTRYVQHDPQILGVPRPFLALEGRLLPSITRSGSSYAVSSSREFDTNAVKVLLDYLTSDQYGPQIPLEFLDLPSFYAAQQQAGQSVQGPGSVVDTSENNARRIAGFDYVGTDGQLNEAGYAPGQDVGFANPTTDAFTPRAQLPVTLHRNEYNGSVSTSRDYIQNTWDILSLMPDARFFWSEEGKYKHSLGDPTRTPAQQSVFMVNDSVLKQPVAVRHASNEDKLNLVTMTFADIEQAFAKSSVTWPVKNEALHNSFLAEDNNEELHETIHLKGCNNHFHARSIAATHVLLTRRTIYIMRVGETGIQLEEGNVIRIQDSITGIDTYARIVLINKTERFEFDITAVEFHQIDYAWTYDEETVLSGLESIERANGVLTSVTATAEGSVVTVTWVANPRQPLDVVSYEIEGSIDGGVTWILGAVVTAQPNTPNLSLIHI